MPIVACAAPSPFTAMPLFAPMSTKRLPPWFTNRKFGIEVDVAGRGGVGPARSRASRFVLLSGLRRDVGEVLAAVVVQENVLAVAGDEDVVEAVAVDVADRHAHPPSVEVEPELRGDVA